MYHLWFSETYNWRGVFGLSSSGCRCNDVWPLQWNGDEYHYDWCLIVSINSTNCIKLQEFLWGFFPSYSTCYKKPSIFFSAAPIASHTGKKWMPQNWYSLPTFWTTPACRNECSNTLTSSNDSNWCESQWPHQQRPSNKFPLARNILVFLDKYIQEWLR